MGVGTIREHYIAARSGPPSAPAKAGPGPYRRPRAHVVATVTGELPISMIAPLEESASAIPNRYRSLRQITREVHQTVVASTGGYSCAVAGGGETPDPQRPLYGGVVAKRYIRPTLRALRGESRIRDAVRSRHRGTPHAYSLASTR